MKTLSAAMAIALASTMTIPAPSWRPLDYKTAGSGTSHKSAPKDKAKRKAQRKARRINRSKP
jgi:hypothetical protein